MATIKNKNKLLALFMAMMMSSSVAALAACKDGDDSSSSDNSSTDSSVVETDSSRINNGSFEFVNWNDGKNLIVTSPTGWSRSTNSATSGTAVSSKSASGIINTDSEAWDNFTKSSLPEGTAAPKTADEARAVWSQMSAYDKLKFYKAWDDADYDENVDKQDFYDATKDKFNVDIDDVPLDKDGNVIKNPGTHKGADEEDSNVLMIHNAYTNGAGTAQKFTSSSTITLQAGTSAEVSLWVKTSNLTYNGGAEVLNERGAYIGITHTVGGKTLDQMQVKNINTEAMNLDADANGWAKYTFYLQGCSFSTSTFTMVLGLGQGGGTDRFEYVEGYAFFDDVECTIISNEAYSDAVDNTIPVRDLDSSAKEKIFETDTANYKNVTTYALNLASSNTFKTFDVPALDPDKNFLTEQKKNGLYYVSADNGKLRDDQLVWNGLNINPTNDVVALNTKDGLAAKAETDGNDYLKAALKSGFEEFPFGDSKTLMILSADGASYTTKMNSDKFVLDAGKKMAVSFFVKTSDMLGITGANVTVRFEGGASTISTINTTDIATVDVDGDNGKDIYKGWQQCFLFIENDTDATDLKFSLEFSYGTSTIVGSTMDNYIEGWAAFTNFEIAEDMDDAFDYAASNTYSKIVSLSDPDEKTYSSAVFDSAQNFTGEEAIKNGIANPNNYIGVKGGSGYVANKPNTDKEPNTNAYAGLISKEYVSDYAENAMANTDNTYWANKLGLVSTTNTPNEALDPDDKLSDEELLQLTREEETKANILALMGNSTQPLLIYNNEKGSYGFIATKSSTISGYTAISVRVKVSAGANAYVYLVDMDDKTHETVLSIDRRVSYWYDKDGNVCNGDPAEKATEVVLELKSNGLYQSKDGGAYYANLKAYTEKDAAGNLLVSEGGVKYNYNKTLNNEGMDGIAFYAKDGKFYADAAKTIEVKDFSEANVPARYTASDAEELFVKVGDTNGKWKTVTFFVAAGATAKNYRLEVWSGSRDGSVENQNPAGSYVMFDTNTAGSLDATSYTTLTDLAIEYLVDKYNEGKAEEDQITVEEYKKKYVTYNAYSFYDDGKFLRYNADLDENGIGNSYDDYNSTDAAYAEVLSYLFYANDDMDAITVFANFTQNDVIVAADVVEEEVEEDNTNNDTTTEGETNWGLLISSLAVAGVLVAVLVMVGVRKFVKWGKKAAVNAKPVKKEKPAKVKKEKSVKEEIAENEEPYND